LTYQAANDMSAFRARTPHLGYDYVCQHRCWCHYTNLRNDVGAPTSRSVFGTGGTARKLAWKEPSVFWAFRTLLILTTGLVPVATQLKRPSGGRFCAESGHRVKYHESPALKVKFSADDYLVWEPS
jgi:hypothetical protein